MTYYRLALKDGETQSVDAIRKKIAGIWCILYESFQTGGDLMDVSVAHLETGLFICEAGCKTAAIKRARKLLHSPEFSKQKGIDLLLSNVHTYPLNTYFKW